MNIASLLWCRRCDARGELGSSFDAVCVFSHIFALPGVSPKQDTLAHHHSPNTIVICTHLHTCTREREFPVTVASLTAAAAAAHTSLVRLNCHSFSRALAISAVPTARYFSQQGTSKHALIGGNGTNPSCQAFSLVSRDCARKSGTCTPRSCWFFVDIRY